MDMVLGVSIPAQWAGLPTVIAASHTAGLAWVPADPLPIQLHANATLSVSDSLSLCMFLFASQGNKYIF